MKRIILFSLLALACVACGGEETPATAPEPTEAAAVPTATSAPEPTTVDDSIDVDNSTSEADAASSGESTGSVSDAVIDTSITTADSLQQLPEDLLADGRVVVGDAGGDEAESALAVSLLTSIVEVSDWLADHPNWQGHAFKQNEFYSVEFRDAASPEWLGRGRVHIGEERIENYFVPRELTDQEFTDGRALIEEYALNEETVLARLGDLDAWNYDMKYRRMEAVWELHFQQGDEQIVIPVDSWEERYFIDDIYDVVTEETADPQQQTAISIAKTGNNVVETLNTRSDWQIYIALQEDSTYAVSFTAPERELFYALVDINKNELIQIVPGFR